MKQDDVIFVVRSSDEASLLEYLGFNAVEYTSEPIKYKDKYVFLGELTKDIKKQFRFKYRPPNNLLDMSHQDIKTYIYITVAYDIAMGY